MKNFKLLLVLFISTLCFSQQIVSEKDRAQLVDEILEERFNVLLPELMDKTNIDMWLVISREYNEDPVIKTILLPTL